MRQDDPPLEHALRGPERSFLAPFRRRRFLHLTCVGFRAGLIVQGSLSSASRALLRGAWVNCESRPASIPESCPMKDCTRGPDSLPPAAPFFRTGQPIPSISVGPHRPNRPMTPSGRNLEPRALAPRTNRADHPAALSNNEDPLKHSWAFESRMCGRIG